MVCKFCGKPLPEVPEWKCPHCMAVWTPEVKKGEDKQPKTERKDVEWLK